jgi:hypothetical protein
METQFYLFDPNNKVSYWNEIVNKYNNLALVGTIEIIYIKLQQNNDINEYNNMSYYDNIGGERIELTHILKDNKPFIIYKSCNPVYGEDDGVGICQCIDKENIIKYIEDCLLDEQPE